MSSITCIGFHEVANLEIVNPAHWAIPVKVVAGVTIAILSATGFIGTSIYSFGTQQQLILDELKKDQQAFEWVRGGMKALETKIDTSDEKAQTSRDAINIHLGNIDLTLQRHQDALDTLVPRRH